MSASRNRLDGKARAPRALASRACPTREPPAPRWRCGRSDLQSRAAACEHPRMGDQGGAGSKCQHVGFGQTSRSLRNDPKTSAPPDSARLPMPPRHDTPRSATTGRQRVARCIPLAAALIACFLPAACSTHNESSSGSVASGAPASTVIDVALEADAPQWVTDLARTLQSKAVQNPPLAIWRYEYNAETVYYVPPRCCDIFSDLYSSTGNMFCHPDGGITGRGDGRCSDFFERRKAEKQIWHDPRGKQDMRR